MEINKYIVLIDKYLAFSIYKTESKVFSILTYSTIRYYIFANLLADDEELEKFYLPGVKLEYSGSDQKSTYFSKLEDYLLINA